MARNDILTDKDGNQIFPATTAEQVSYDGKINVKQAIKRGAIRNKVASTAVAMTDKEQIYVYTGTEEGYTFGHWYYYDGSAWVIGGVYNAVEVETDKDLTESGKAADAKVTGDEINGLKSDICNLSDWKVDKPTDGNGTKGQALLTNGDGTTYWGEYKSGESSTGTYIDYDANVKAVAHRGYSTEAPENTIPAYILAKKKGFKYVECDVSFTYDGVPVLLHDSTIDRTSNGSGNIGSITYSEALMYDFGSWKSSAYAGTKIPTFEEFIYYCKGLGLHPYIELKDTASYTEEQIANIVDIVRNAGMEGKVSYISFSITYLGYVKNSDSKARIGYIANISSSSITAILALKTEENKIFIDASYANATEANCALCAENDIPVEVWTVNSNSVIENQCKYISGVTSDSLIAGKILYDKYIVYSAPDAPEVPATNITLDKTSLSFTDSTSQTIVATIEPTYSSDKIVWSSTNEGVATINNGVVSPVANGSCTITATAGSVSASCNVVVDIEIPLATYTITRNLTNCTSSNTATTIMEGSTLSETLTASSGYKLDAQDVTVTMGENDVSSYYTDGTINISSVTGNIVITAIGTENVYEVVRTFAGDELQNVGTGPSASATPPYTKQLTTRLTYIDFDVFVEDGYTYKMTYETDLSTTNMGLQFYSEDTYALVQSNQDMPAAVDYDPGWLTNGYEFTVPIAATTKDIKGFRFTFRRDSGSTTLNVGDIYNVQLWRKKS